MNLVSLRDRILLPQKEIIIDKAIKVNGLLYHIISLTDMNEEKRMWVLKERDTSWVEYCNEYGEPFKKRTYRDQVADRVIRKDETVHISNITLQNKTINFRGSTESVINKDNRDIYMKLQHFYEHGFNYSLWDDISLRDMCLGCYEIDHDFDLGTIDSNGSMDVKVDLGHDSKEIMIDTPLTITVNMEPETYTLHDNETDEDFILYINKVEHYDAWENMLKLFEDERITSRFTKEELEEQKSQMIENVRTSICPENKNLAIIEYETDNNRQLNIYTKKHLDTEVKNNGTCAGFIMRPDEKIGPYGFDNRVTDLDPIDKDFYGDIEIIIFSMYKTIEHDIEYL